jgi:uncharacterized protein with HEPN domain
MPRSAAAFLVDVVDACDGIAEVLRGVDLEKYRTTRPIRSAVEREFTIIGEAVSALARRDPELAAGISRARLIVGFRNQIVHACSQIDDETVYAIARHDVPALRAECVALRGRMTESDA